jgi:hypothetical protein
MTILLQGQVFLAKAFAGTTELSCREVVTFLDCFTVNEGWVLGAPFKPDFGLSGIPQRWTRLFCHPEPDPDFLPRIAGHSRVCCFRYGKQHEARQRHQAQQEIRGSGPAVRLSIKQLRSL